MKSTNAEAKIPKQIQRPTTKQQTHFNFNLQTQIGWRREENL